MTIWKKILLVYTILTLSLPLAFGEAAYAAETADEATCELMAAIGLIDNVPAGNAVVTRGEWIPIAARLKQFNIDVTTDAISPFTDIPADSPLYSAVCAAHFGSLLPFVTESKLDPSKPLKPAELAASLVAVLDYGSYAQATGGYPTGYNLAAGRLRLLPSNTDINADVNWDLLVKAVDNTLKTRPMILSSIGNDTEFYEADEILLTHRFKIKRYTGLFQADPYTHIFYPDSKLREGTVQIGGMVFNTAGKDTDGFLGCKVEIYYYADDEDPRCYDLISISRHIDNEILTIEHGELDYADSNVIEYRRSDDRLRRVNLSPSATLIYNGKQRAFDSRIFYPEHGEVKLIDNNYDRKYDIICVNDYNALVVDRISEISGTISDKISGNSIQLDDKKTDYFLKIIKNGESASFSDISVGNIVLYGQSVGAGLEKRTLLVSDTIVSGSVTTFTETKPEIEINGEITCRVSEGMIDSIKIGTEGTFYIDSYGTVVYMTIGQFTVYGFLNAMAVKDFDSIHLRIYSQNGRWVTLPLADKLKFDDETGVTDKEAYKRLGNGEPTIFRQLITYRVSQKREICEINLAKKFVRWSQDENEAIDNRIFRINEEMTANFRPSGLTFEGNLAPTSDTVIFMIPKTGTNEDDFSISSSGNLSETSYTLKAYDCDRLYQPAVCVIYGKPASLNNINGPGSIMVVDRLGRGLNPNDSISYSVRGMYKGSLMNIYTETDAVVDSISGGLKSGDIIQFELDDKGCVSSINVMYRCQDTPVRGTSTGLYSNVAVFLSGDVMGIDSKSDRISLRYDAQKAYVLNTAARLTSVYIYDTGNKTVTIGSLGDLAIGDYIFTSARYSLMCEMVIIKTP